MHVENRLQTELSTFGQVWRDGYYEGDIFDPVATSSYGDFGYLSVLHAIYLYCIKPYITTNTIALEIGPGRGAWTKALLHAQEVWCLDAKTREDNDIDRYLGYPPNLVYFQVKDFSCKELPDNYFDFLFSFGALCHVSWEGIERYAYNLYPKLRSGANAFIMVADYDKANAVRSDPWRYDAVSRLLSAKRLWPIKVVDRRLGYAFGKRSMIWDSLDANWQSRIERLAGTRLLGRTKLPYKDKTEDAEPRPGRWFHAGTDKTVALLKEIGYQVVNSDIGLVNRDPVIHFIKP